MTIQIKHIIKSPTNTHQPIYFTDFQTTFDTYLSLIASFLYKDTPQNELPQIFDIIDNIETPHK